LNLDLARGFDDADGGRLKNVLGPLRKTTVTAQWWRADYHPSAQKIHHAARNPSSIHRAGSRPDYCPRRSVC
jgi:hypothetical protein